jgi:hypothetical protein
LERDLDWLVEYFERYLAALQTELASDPDNEFLKGKINGMKHALVRARMYNIDEKGRHQIDVIIDTPILQNTSEEYNSLLKGKANKDKNGNALNVNAGRLEIQNSQLAAEKLRSDFRKNNKLIKDKFREATRRPE